MIKTYDFTKETWHNIIRPIDNTPAVYCNDNLTPDEKQQAYDDWYEWIYEFLSIIDKDKDNNNVIYLEDYLR